MEKVTIEIDSRWVKIVHSPLYWIVAALQGVSVTFAPMFLYWSGKGMFDRQFKWLVVVACYGVIFLVGFFYMLLGGAVVGELRKKHLSA